MGKNPLRAILAETINFERMARAPTKLFITATNVRTGRGHVFKNNAVTPDVLLASACLPTMFQAVEIDGEPYWDGGYSGNPTITPLIRECKSQDTILVQINPVERESSPRSASESVREHQTGLQSFRSMRRIDARRKNASALRFRFSQSFASRRQRLSHAIVRSTTQRRGSTTNPLA